MTIQKLISKNFHTDLKKERWQRGTGKSITEKYASDVRCIYAFVESCVDHWVPKRGYESTSDETFLITINANRQYDLKLRSKWHCDLKWRNKRKHRK